MSKKFIITGLGKGDYGTGNPISPTNILELGSDNAAVGDYLPLSGGTLSGDINMSHANGGIYFGNTPGTVAYIRKSGTTEGQIEIGSDNAINFKETDDNIIKGSFTTNDGVFDATGGFKWDGQSLDNRYLSIDGQDNNVRIININPTLLPTNYTRDDVATYLNTLNVTKTDIETLVINIDDTDPTLTLDWGNVTNKPDLNVSNWDSAFNWGNHASAGYLKNLLALTPGTGLIGTTYVGTVARTFAVSYGTAANTAAQGNDSRINNGQTAYGWGNHASAGYATGSTFNSSGTYSGLRAQATTASDVGLGNVSNVGATTTSTANTIAQRDSSGDINARLFRSQYSSTNSNIGFIMTQVNTGSDNYVRPSTPTQVKSSLGLTNAVSSTDGTLINIWHGSQVQYDAITTPNNNTIYFIEE